MANYYLRNPGKIIEHYGEDILQRIYDSLDHHFRINMSIRYDCTEINEFDPYPQIVINDMGHTCALIVFYVVRLEGYTYRLAFKEFCG